MSYLDCSLRTHLHKCLCRMTIVSYNRTKWRETNPGALKRESKGSTKYEYQRLRSTESEHEEHGNTAPPAPPPLLLSLPPPLLPPTPPSFYPSPVSPSTPYPSLFLSLTPPLLPPHILSQLLQREYGDYLVSPEQGYDISVQFSYESLPENKGTCGIIKTLSQGRQNSAGGLSQTLDLSQEPRMQWGGPITALLENTELFDSPVP